MTTPSDAFVLFCSGNGLWVDAFTIALGQASNGKWYTSTLELQLASFRVCVLCRGVRTLRVIAETGMPSSLWDDEDRVGGSLKAPGGRRVPTMRAAGVEWLMPGEMFVPTLSEAALVRGVQWLKIEGLNEESLRSNPPAISRWGDLPKSLTRLVHSPRSYFEAMLSFLGRKENLSSTQKLGTVSWPPGLRQLSLGSLRDCKRMELGGLPNSLERLTLGGHFDQPIESATWPVSLKRLTLGPSFNQPIVDVVWPRSLLQLTFGGHFNQPVADVVWPASLLQLSFGELFDQPIADVVWPSFLVELIFGSRFDQPIVDVAWPASLQQLAFSWSFDQPIADVVWPASLRQLIIRGVFNQPIAKVVWPASLTRLELCPYFNQPIQNVSWPCALQYLEFGYEFDQPIQGVVWPASLRQLMLPDDYSQPMDGVVWPPCVEVLVPGNECQQPTNDWPPGPDSFDLSKICYT